MYDKIKLFDIAQTKDLVKKTTKIKKKPKFVTIERTEEEIKERFIRFLKKKNKQFLFNSHYNDSNSKLWNTFLNYNKKWFSYKLKRVPTQQVFYNFK